MMDNAKYKEMFVQEAHEHVQSLNESLLKLEKEPAAKEYLDAAFRSAHTLKGMAATMGYDQIKQLCKTIEEFFDKFRNGEAKLTSKAVNSLFKCFDLLEEMVDGDTKSVDLEPYLKELQSISEDESANSSEISSSSQMKAKSTIRVKMEDLDSIVNQVGELLIAKMRLEQAIPDTSEGTREVLTTLSRLVSDLQYQTMKIRLVPIEQIFYRFPRMVRDLSASLGKEVKLEMEGLGIELDRTILDAITDPLLHILRNAVDHGIETPSEREGLGKPKAGTIKLRASRIGDKVEIRIDDDGNGINVERIKSIAVEKQIISKAKAEIMSDEEVLALLGTPGLTSASNVTDVSGRGVGLDVVFSQVEGMGGQVKIVTKKGQGTTITLTIPSTLAIIGGLLVTVADEKYVLPLSSITTTLKVDKREIKKVHGQDVVILRDQVIPLIRVSDALGIKNNNMTQANGKIAVVIVDTDGKSYGLVVDSFERKQEIVMKPIERKKNLIIKRADTSSSSSSTFSDATILPDGRIALVLDPAMLV